MNRKISLGTAIALVIISIAVTICITMVVSTRNFSDMVYLLKERENMYDKVSEIDRLVRQNYNGTIDEMFLNDSMASGYMYGIGDKHSQYLNAEQHQALTASYEGKIVGIGVSVAPDPSGYIKVTEVYKDSPADDLGITVGDMIVKVGELDVTAENYIEATDAIKGEEGSKIKIVVRKDKEDREIDITRRSVEVPTVTFKMHDKIAYIQIKKFNDLTTDQFKEAIKNASSQNAKAIVFDVRNNLGGTITSVTAVLDILLPKGPIVTAVYKDGTEELLGESDAKEIDLPMAVLINEKTASAAELFAQALKDYDKAQVVGVQSYGKGSMQRLYKLSDGSAIDLTIAKYNPPKSQNYDGVGVTPDYEVKLSVEEQKNFLNLDENSDPQLRKALDLMNQKTDSLPGTVVEEPAKEDTSISESTEEENTEGETETSAEETSSDNKETEEKDGE